MEDFEKQGLLQLDIANAKLYREATLLFEFLEAWKLKIWSTLIKINAYMQSK